MATWKDVGRIVGQLPETAEASPRNWRVRKKLMVWERPLRKADYAALGDDAPDGDILGARVADEGVKYALIADDPDVYFTTPHFDGYPMVLVRLGRDRSARTHRTHHRGVARTGAQNAGEDVPRRGALASDGPDDQLVGRHVMPLRATDLDGGLGSAVGVRQAQP